MRMDTRPRRLVLLLASALAVALAACTLLLDRSNTQCATNGDCAHFNANAVCVAGFCQLSGTLSDAGVDAPSKGGEGGEGRPDARSDAPSCPPGCFSGTPT